MQFWKVLRGLHTYVLWYHRTFSIYRVFHQGRYKIRATGTSNDAILLADLLTFFFLKVWHFMMERYISQHGVEIIEIYYRNSESMASAKRSLRQIYGRHNHRNRTTIERLVVKLESIGTLQMFPFQWDLKCP